MPSEGYVVVLCVCLSTTILALQANRRLISDTTASVLQGHEKQCGDFAKTTALRRYGVKTSKFFFFHN